MAIIHSTRTAAICCAAMLLGTAAIAQPAPAPAIGETVLGNAGAEIGKISAMAGGDAIVDTGTHKVSVPAASFARTNKGLSLAATKEQIDTFGQQAEDAAKAAMVKALVPGSAVNGINGKPLGTVKTVDAGLVELKTANGDVKLPATAFIVSGGVLSIGMTQAEFDAAVTSAVKPG